MFAKYYTLPELRKMGLHEKATISELINEDGVTFQLASLALLAKEE
jgi:hypothetical protein